MIVKKIPLREGRKDVTLTTYVLDDSWELLNGKRRPAVLICPGGGYLYCSDREAEPVALRFAAMGYHAFVLRYSVYYKGEGFPAYAEELKPRPETAHPAPVQDMGLAMKCIHQHAEEWLVDTDRIAICGFSGGSHNCAMYSVYWNKPLITDFIGVEEGLPPAAVILGYGVSDNKTLEIDLPVISFPDLLDAYTIALFGEKNPDVEKQRTLSPSLLVDEHVPPTFLWATTGDETVPVIQTVSMAESLVRKQIPIEMHIFEDGSHGLALATQATATALSTIVPAVSVWLDMADRWLQKRFLLPLPALTEWE